MQNKGMKVVAATLAAIIVAGGYSTTAKASSVMSDMPGAGISVVLNETNSKIQENKAAEKAEDTENNKAQDTAQQEDQKEEQKETTELVQDTVEKEPEVKNEYDNIAIAQVSNYVNLRSEPSEEGEILGKLYNNSAATIISTEGDWYKIKSGSVDGYVKAEFVVSGAEAEALAKEVGHRIATVNTETLKVRNDAGLDATVQTLIPEGESYDVVEEMDGWVKIAVDTDIEGYVSADYVNLETEFVQAESIEEEQARLAEEERVRKEAEEAARQADEAAKKKKQSSEAAASSESSASTSNASAAPAEQPAAPAVSAPAGGSRASIVNYALQFVGNPYVAGGTSLTNGADCSGFVQSVFRDCGISIPRDSRSQAAGGVEVSLGAIQPGDLLFYSDGGAINHVALYIGNGQVVHASTAKTGIKISSYNYRTPCKAVTYIY
ncbi:MAG: C40 family peptidase [Lachnospiraceae bacterium]|nr:C40 family peptidase [Lachnospiraceae bacterium]